MRHREQHAKREPKHDVKNRRAQAQLPQIVIFKFHKTLRRSALKYFKAPENQD